ncbi:hypothetical protein ACNKHN_16605 [Shigella flexneri]
MAVLAHAGITRQRHRLPTVIRTSEYIRLALIGERWATRSIWSLRRCQKLPIVLDEAERLNVVSWSGAYVHVWRREARVNGGSRPGKIEVWPGSIRVLQLG